MSLTRVPRRMLDVDIADQQYVQDQISALTTDSISEGLVNRYFTDERARLAITISGGLLTYDVSTGTLGLSVTDIATVARQSLTVTGALEYNSTTGVLNYSPNIPTTESIQDIAAGLLTSGVNQGVSAVYDDANNRVNLSVTVGTDQVAEGTTNLYFTEARARDSLQSGSGIYYDAVSGVINANPFFANIAVTGQTPVTADITNDTINMAPAANGGMTITTIPGTNTINFGVNPFFATIQVPGRTNVTADVTGDFFKLVAGANMTITTIPGENAVVFASTGGGGGGGGSVDPIEMISTAMIYG